MILRICATLVLAVCAASTPARGEKEMIDRIVAVVEDEAIFQSDVDDVVRQIIVSTGRLQRTDEEVAQLRREALENLINDMLVVAQAARLDIDIPFSEVEENVTKRIEENKRMLGGEEAFESQLEREGFTIDSLKQLYRRQERNRMLVERVLQIDMARNRREPTEDELRSYYHEHLDEIPARPAVVHLKTILVGFETSTSASAKARSAIDDIHARALRGESFSELARALSEDPSSQLGGDLGFVNPDDLADPNFRDAVNRLEIGEISEPVLTAYGWHIIQVSERDPERGVRVRHVLVGINPTDGDIAQVFDTARTIHQDLLAGTPFDSLADRYSTDPTAGAGGDLGWLKIDDLPEYFRSVLEGMAPGDVSQVLREPAGFRIVKLLEREEQRRYGYDEVRGQLKQLWQQEQMARAYGAYVEKLKERFTVDRKPDVVEPPADGGGT